MIGLAIGGYDTRRGTTEHCIIVNNTLYQDRGVELLVQFNTQDNVIENNIVVANSGRQFLQNIYRQTYGNVIDHNLYYAPGGGDRGTWQWKGTTYRSFADYVRVTGNDRNSLFTDPRFADPAAANFQLGPGSPAIDAGLPACGGKRRRRRFATGGSRGDRPRGVRGPRSRPVPDAVPVGLDLLRERPGVRPGDERVGPVETDTSNGEKKLGDGHAITIGGQTFAKGLGVHAPSIIKVSLGIGCSAFEADVGVDDEVGDAGSVDFQVWGDGKKLYDSGVVRGTQGSTGAYANLTGVQTMRLLVFDGGDGVDNDHADWGNARVACG